MIKLKKLAALAISLAAFTAIFTGCGDDENSSAAGTKDDSSSSSAESNGKLVNFTPPQNGEEIIVMTIKGYGDVKIKLFPEQADKGVENFTTHAKNGYYDDLIFHRVINNFMIQGGDPLGTGIGGESIWGEKFDGGASADLTHVAGSVAYANSGGTNTDGSQFYIVTGETYDEATLTQLTESYDISFSDETKELYKTIGGTPWLDGSYTIFGQVFDGLDIVYDIQGVETVVNDKPATDVVIEKMTVEKYNGEDVKFYMSDYE